MKRRNFLAALVALIWGCGGGSSDMRELGRERTLDGQPIDYEAIPLRRYLSDPESSTGLLKDYVTATPALSTTELSVAKAFYVLFGRAPDRTGLAYWSGVLGSGATLAQAVDTIVLGIAGANIMDPDNGVFIELMYNYLFGKVPEEDPSGQTYWRQQLDGGTSKGTVVQTMLEAVVSLTGWHADCARNRLLVVESICRLQKAYSYDMGYQDSKTSVLRVVGSQISYEESMSDVKRLIVDRIASTPNTWAVTLTASTFYSRCRLVDNSDILQHRWLVWYNSAGEMMLATAYLPPNWTSVSSHRAIVSLHGGGWRQGYPERLYSYNTDLASGTDPSYVVLGPNYKLSAYGYTSPSLEQDAKDFYNLLVTYPSFLKIDNSKIGLFGESSGGHLACMVGATQSVPRVLAMYPPIDLRGTPSVSSGLDVYVNYFAPTTTKKQQASANYRWTNSITTKFQLWHGLGDSFVPASQSDAMKTAVGANCTVIKVDNEGHGFTTPTKNAVLAAAKTFFDERNPL